MQLIPDDVVQRLLGLKDPNETLILDINNGKLPLRFKQEDASKKLVVLFHGAVDKSTRTPPVFAPFVPNLGVGVDQLAVSDPSIMEDGDFPMAWYAGHQGFFTQKILKEILDQLISVKNYDRIVFMGSSGGGFASLYFSQFYENSVALALVPQTNIAKYYKGIVDRYFKFCWPKSDAGTVTDACFDVCQIYSNKTPNTVIYVQSAGDKFHSRAHFAPFLNAISSVASSKFIAYSGYWGVKGHSGAVPKKVFIPWLQTALTCPTLEVDDLLDMHNRLSLAKNDRTFDPKGSSKAAVVDQQKIQFADFLRDHQLQVGE